MRGWLRNNKHQTDFMMFHHRWPTSTVNVRRAAHPFSTGDYFGDTKYVLVHNGHVSNSKTLKDNHEALGISYTSTLEDGTFNDSESLLWDVALTLEGKQEKLEAYGGIAFVAAKVVGNDITHLYFGKNPGRPLNMYREKEGLMLSSEGIGTEIDDHTLYTYNYKLNRLTTRYFKIPAYAPYTSTWNENDRYAYTTGQTTYTYYGTGSTSSSSRIDEVLNETLAAWGTEGVDYWYGEDGEVIFRDEWDEENETGRYQVPTYYGGKAPAALVSEANEQQWYLEDYLGIDDDDLRDKDIYDHYMTQANGLFTEAFDLIDTDLSYFTAHERSIRRDLIVRCLEGGMRMLLKSNSYENEESVDEEYFKPVPMVSQTFAQNALLIGAAQEG